MVRILCTLEDCYEATFKILLPKPCSQPWDEMTPEAGGRHCLSCAKTVVDFTRMTDAQILEVMRSYAGGCGRFRTDQVNRELIAPLANKKFPLKYYYKLAASLLLLFSAGKVTAQEKKEVPPQESVSDTLKQVYRRITGLVTDSEGEPLTGTTIQLDGQSISLTAGIDGEFEMHIPDSAFAAGTVGLTFSYVGYQSRGIIFSIGDFPLSLKLKMERPSKEKSLDDNLEILSKSGITRQSLTPEDIEHIAIRNVSCIAGTFIFVLEKDIRAKERELQYKQRENRLDEFIQDYGQ